jgi:hypothetical protein
VLVNDAEPAPLVVNVSGPPKMTEIGYVKPGASGFASSWTVYVVLGIKPVAVARTMVVPDVPTGMLPPAVSEPTNGLLARLYENSHAVAAPPLTMLPLKVAESAVTAVGAAVTAVTAAPADPADNAATATAQETTNADRGIVRFMCPPLVWLFVNFILDRRAQP